ncbi:MAG: hypothetical protein JWM33_2597 [Caulobacteraceae bacterium]|nr:hypothetical protein [Caulobacteraceae bacterium]
MAPAQRALMVEALLWLALARLLLLVTPFRLVAGHLGAIAPPHEARARGPQGGAEAQRAKAIGWAIRRAAANAPFKAACLQQAIAAKMMLRRRGIPSALHLGFITRMTDQARRPHAWLHAAGAPITGYPLAVDVVELVCFF